jgi:hypothetical protein
LIPPGSWLEVFQQRLQVEAGGEVLRTLGYGARTKYVKLLFYVNLFSRTPKPATHDPANPELSGKWLA